MRPVYREVDDLFRLRWPARANTGLVYDRYADIWSGPPQWKPQAVDSGKTARQAFLEEIAKHALEVARHVAPLLQAFHDRRAALWRMSGARVVEVELASPLISGIGMASALEVGFTWDHGLGIPYLPATGLKGVARAWAELWDTERPEMAQRIFGDSSDSGAGSVVFHALYPFQPPKLRLDVLNPHFADYYGGGDAPGDWLKPNPVFFLTVAPGGRFRTAIQPRPAAGPDDLDRAEQWLRDALATLGVGAKTAVGYGFFAPSGGGSARQ